MLIQSLTLSILDKVDNEAVKNASVGRKITHSMITATPERKTPEEEYFTLVKVIKLI